MNTEMFDIHLTFDFDTKVVHDGNGHVHIGFGVEVGGKSDFNRVLAYGATINRADRN